MPVLVWSLAIIAGVYLLVNLALLHGLGLKGLADSKARARTSCRRAFGTPGAAALSLFVAVAALTSINATMIVGARTNYAMGRDWPALRVPGRLARDARHAGRRRFVVQGAIALALVAFGALQHDGFEAMVEFTAPVFWSFLFLVGVVAVRPARDATAARNGRSACRCTR